MGFKGCWPQAVNYGATLDMSTMEQNKIEVTIRYDKAWAKELEGNEGKTVLN